jgi:hypothetical protein
MTKELIEGSYMEALLRAAILLGDLRRATPVYEITISGFLIQNNVRQLYPRCRIAAQIESQESSAPTVISTSPGEDYLILYPFRNNPPLPNHGQ